MSGRVTDAALGPDSSVYVVGYEETGGFIATPGALRTSVPQGIHSFLMRIKPDGSGPIFATYIAGDARDDVYAVAVDSAGNAYVGGDTSGFQSELAISGTLLGVPPPVDNYQSAFVMKVDRSGSSTLGAALVPGVSVNALALDASSNIYTVASGGPPFASFLVTTEIDPSLQQLLRDSSARADLTGFPAIAVNSAGHVFVALTGPDFAVPMVGTPQTSAPSAGFLLDLDPKQDQSDVQVTVQSNPGVIAPRGSVDVVFAITNNGPESARNVVFGMPRFNDPSLSVVCHVSGNGTCDQVPWVQAEFPILAAGETQTVTATITTSSIAPSTTTFLAAALSLSSDANQSNNTVSFTIASNITTVLLTEWFIDPLRTYKTPGLTCRLTGAFISPLPGWDGCGSFNAPAGTQFQIYYPSPQTTNIGGWPAIFVGWTDGNTSNPRTFTATGSSMQVGAKFQLLTQPWLPASGIVNSGSYAANGVSPGELISLFGANISVPVSASLVNGAFPTSLGGVSVLFDGVPAPLIYASPFQANAIVPYSVAGKNSTVVTLQVGANSTTATVPVLPAVPALFTANASGTGQVSALNQDTTVNSPQNPAHAGDIIVLYGTGEGLVQPTPADGTISVSTPPKPELPISVMIGNQPAEIFYSGDAPALTAGVIQINVRIPDGISNNSQVPVTWSAGDFTSPPGTTIAVK